MNKKDFIIEYIKNGEKSCENERIGVEFEHLILNEEGRAVGYFDNGGTKDIFTLLTEKEGFTPHIEDDHILSCSKGDFYLSTEPGGQIEFSSKAMHCVKSVEVGLLDFYDMIIPIVESFGNGLYTVPFQPISLISDYEILPKERYYAMFDYFKNHGKMSHLMMKGTTSLQCSIDYMSERDYQRKYGMATRLTNIFYTLFDNVAFVKDRPIDTFAYRALIWQNTDPQRTGVLERAFKPNYGYGDYAEAVLKTPAIFDIKNGKFSRFNGTIEEALNLGDIDELEHLLTMVFFDVRTKNFIEIRMIDSLPYPINVGVVALIKSIFYSNENLERLWNMLGDLTYKEHLRSREEIYKKGPKAKMMGKTLERWGEEILSSLEVNKTLNSYLEPIIPLMTGYTLRQMQIESYKKYAIAKNAIEINRAKTHLHTPLSKFKDEC